MKFVATVGRFIGGLFAGEIVTFLVAIAALFGLPTRSLPWPLVLLAALSLALGVVWRIWIRPLPRAFAIGVAVGIAYGIMAAVMLVLH